MNDPVEIPEVKVTVNEVIYMPSLDAPGDRPHPFVYFLTIRNEGAEAVQILARKWVVEEDNGETIVVEGEGLVGKKPHLEPGGSFSYNSYHVLACDGRANGAFFGVTAGGKTFFTRVPSFEMTIPQWA
ncbi:Co2+/Mg2+ efflux protein ApaG [soil metagenome]